MDEHVYGRETRKLVLLKRGKRMNLSYGDRKSINIPLDRILLLTESLK